MSFKQKAGLLIRLCGVAAFAGCMHCGGKLAGSEVTNEKYQATLYLPDGKPAKSANVLILPADHVPSNTHGAETYAASAIVRTTTDEQGRYSLQALADINSPNTSALYNILADQDSLMVFHDSIQVIPSLSGNLKDTLRNSVSLSGVVKIQPNHDVSTVIVQAIGTNLFVNVDSKGKFSFPKVALGDYRLKISTTLPDYVPTYVPITISTLGNMSPADTITLHYSGIPVVTGLQARFDTVSGTVMLTWNPVVFSNLADYVVFRDPFDSVQFSTKPIASATDTQYIDSVISLNTPAGAYRYKYRVAARNNSFQTGLTYKYVSVNAVSLGAAAIRIIPVDSTNPLVKPFLVVAEIRSPNVPISKIQWSQINPSDSLRDTVIKTRTLSKPANAIIDSVLPILMRRGPTHFMRRLVCSVEDSLGRSFRDSISIWLYDTLWLDTSKNASMGINVDKPNDAAPLNDFPYISAVSRNAFVLRKSLF